jgi:uncharacterized protein (TIGR03382 family)
MLLLIRLALGGFPLPTYPQCGEPDRPDLCPAEMEGRWNMLSYVPAAWSEPSEAAERAMGGTGMSIDRAFRVTTGRTDVMIAVIDSGVHWEHPDLLEKWALNAGELPLPEGATTHDANGDGAVTIADWAGDSRVSITAGDDAADDVLDPSDLIATFSDGEDDDGNGYVDDICGWDFLWDDNNPYDDVRFGHGTGISRDAAAAGENGGDVGACPNCTILPVRAGDSFVVDGSAFGSALAFAIDSHAQVAAVAVGAVQQPSWVEALVDRAWSEGLLMIGSAADENAYHPNPPGMAAHTFYVHAITTNEHEPADADSYVAYSNCTNHGVRLDGSASSENCSSGATGMTGGISGLVISAARPGGWAPTPAEMHALLSGTADDIALPDDPSRWPSATGWDAWSGWGRLNAETAVVAARSGEVPPTAEITSPLWYDVLTSDGASELVVTGTAASRFDAVASWKLSWGAGLAPAEWTEVASGTGAVDGELARMPMPALWQPLAEHARGADPVERELAVNVNTVQLRFVVTDTAGRVTTARMAFYVDDDPDRVDGFPLDLGASMEASPAVVDLDGDGRDEIILATGDGWIHVLTGDGGELPGWPQHTELLRELDPANPNHNAGSASWQALGGEAYAPVTASPALGDLDGDGTLEVVVASFRGRLHVFGADGTPRAGFPVRGTDIPGTVEHDSLADCFFSTPALGDLDGDGALEIVIGGGDGYLHAWRHDGSYADGFPVRLAWPDEDLADRRIVASPALGDLDGDGTVDIVIGTNETIDEDHAVLYAVSGTGELLPGWPRRLWGVYVDVLPLVGQGVPNSAALVDLFGDELPEIIVHGLAGDVRVLDATGEELLTASSAASAYGEASNVDDASILPLINSPSVGDLDGDGVPDFVDGAAGIEYALGQDEDGHRFDFDHALGGWSGVDGTFLPGFPRLMEDLQFFQNPAIVDIDGDRRMEVIAGSGGFVLHAWNADGESPEGWPKLTGQWMIAAPAVGDLDGDGTLEVVALSRAGWVFAWHTDSPANADAGWVTYGHDPQRTFNYETPLPGFNGRKDAPGAEEEGCGCGGSNPAAAGVALALAGALARRRRATGGARLR